ncbi:FMN-binding negative transcriptional regulator [Massilia dura]|uniref:FMN-binding negative transcriptional regulator n=1 Tax=Pseudoduganella dura TaxID=321982 RepID=A0A6I3XGH8_9BURK|nr:FMN-binding negative transcriptional regulator [Pseudoduganella dura]MUI15984.1 FMN-binding negative transcriptional regulator [Pseudoduganella dura]GGX95016.1 transcriptional regulator [Pseudoduganella dura]
MHCPTTFREERLEALHGLMRAYPLATLITAGSDGLVANLVPFSLHDGGERGILRAHLGRGNRQLDALREGAETLVVFQGPESYVSPSWYPSKAEHGKVVPTWNFTVVQVRGEPRVIDDPDWIRAQVRQMTDNHESGREHPWQVADAPDDFITALIAGIAGIEIPVLSIEGKWKASQNRAPADRQGVIDGLKADGRCPGMVDWMERG